MAAAAGAATIFAIPPATLGLLHSIEAGAACRSPGLLGYYAGLVDGAGPAPRCGR